MSIWRRRDSRYLWVKFKIGGRRIRKSARTTDPSKAEEFETRLRNRLWRQIQLGEQQHSFRDAAEKYLAEIRGNADYERIKRRLNWFLEVPEFAELALHDIDREMLASAQAKLAETLSPTTVNHYLATVRVVLYRAKEEWAWLTTAPKVPMFRRTLPDPRWATRAQVRKLVSLLPEHSADMARFAVATGWRKSNITGLTWDRVDLRRRTAYVPGSQAKARRGIPAALNAEAVAVLKRWQGRHPHYVFVYRDRPIQKVSTRRWRLACKEAGLEGFRFHDLRHTWASWQIQSGTPMAVVKEMGGWASLAMVERYGHLSPGHLRRYASRTLLGSRK